MSAKQENTFIAGVHKHLPNGVYKEKMSNPYRGGTPDVYYEARFTLWVEYKFIEVPKRADTLITPALTPLQKDWLQRCYDNGHNCRVIVGSRAGGVVLGTPGTWLHGITAGEFVESIKTKKEIADILSSIVSP
jgi:hypothetical protein